MRDGTTWYFNTKCDCPTCNYKVPKICHICPCHWGESSNGNDRGITMSESEHLTDKWLEWLLETGMSSIDSLMYEHWATEVDCECSVCTAFHHSEKQKEETKCDCKCTQCHSDSCPTVSKGNDRGYDE